ncbi:carbohydrate ABC transporter substrate-binding protein [Alteromonadaceae bacterium M269]|nr:carbohydrate ABC transporter substrate-binding protein [Alteromonadaceae bacterium M269]
MRNLINKKLGLFIVLIFGIAVQSGSIIADESKTTLKVSMLIFSVEQRNVFEEIAIAFNKRYPNVDIQYISHTDANYKKNSALWLENPEGIDVINWLWSRRIGEYVDVGWIEPISDLWSSAYMESNYSQEMKQLVTFSGEQYAMPYSVGVWGFYYRESLFEHLKLEVPSDWQQLLEVCETLKEKQVTPIIIGAEQPWPTAAWFDLLNLRINGLGFHRQVVSGSVPFTSPKIRNVFSHWKALMTQGCFNRHATKVGFKEVTPLIFRNNAGMILAGSFLVTQVPTQIRDDFKFFSFPVINTSVEISEEAPIDMFLIPQSSKNKVIAKQFIKFISEAESQALINNTIHFMPANSSSLIGESYFSQVGKEALEAAKGRSQYLDRDAPFDFAKKSLRVFARFLEDGDIERAQSELESLRLIHFK